MYVYLCMLGVHFSKVLLTWFTLLTVSLVFGLFFYPHTIHLCSTVSNCFLVQICPLTQHHNIFKESYIFNIAEIVYCSITCSFYCTITHADIDIQNLYWNQICWNLNISVCIELLCITQFVINNFFMRDDWYIHLPEVQKLQLIIYATALDQASFFLYTA